MPTKNKPKKQNKQQNIIPKICIYNKNHKFDGTKIEAHEAKCPDRAKHQLTDCPYNAEHTPKKMDLDRHMKECPDKPLPDLELQKKILKEKEEKEAENKREKELREDKIEETKKYKAELDAEKKLRIITNLAIQQENKVKTKIEKEKQEEAKKLAPKEKLPAKEKKNMKFPSG
jgi:hypothetical protein